MVDFYCEFWIGRWIFFRLIVYFMFDSLQKMCHETARNYQSSFRKILYLNSTIIVFREIALKFIMKIDGPL